MSLAARSVHDAIIFISCADEDREFFEGLHRALSGLMREGRVECRSRHLISPGSDWQNQAKADLQVSNIILLLVSPSFVQSDYCYLEEAVLAMHQHWDGKAHVIPINLIPTVGIEGLLFGTLKFLPEGKAVNLWSNKEEAWANITRGIQGVVEDLKARVQDTGKPSLYWNVPYWRNPFFTNRTDVLKDLREAFISPHKSLSIQAVSGLPGVGKTQVAIEYAYRYAESYQAVLWVHAESAELLVSGFVGLAATLGLPQRNQADQPTIIKSVKAWLQRHPRWLLVVDNLEDVDLLQDLVPSPHAGHILVTTRSHRTGQIAQRIDLAPMPTDESALLLLRRAKLLSLSANLSQAPDTDSTLAKQIAEATEGLPLALDQAGAYIEETGRSLSTYVALYQQFSSSLLKRRGAASREHPSSVTTTFTLSLEKVGALNAVAVELLKLCAFLHSDAIPEDMIVDGASALPETLRTAVTNPLEFDLAIESLLKFSLIRRESHQNYLSIHRLVQAVVRDTLSEEEQQQHIKYVVNLLNTIFPTADFSNWAICQRYLPQAQACVKLIEQRKVLLPEASQLLYKVGTYLTERGLYAEAEAALKQASAIEETLLGPNHPATLPLFNALADLFFKKGEYGSVVSLSRRTLALAEQTPEANRSEIGRSLNTLAKTYHKQGRYAEAEPLFQQALAVREQVLGPQHPDVATTLNNLANLYNRQGKYEETETLYRQALTIQQQALDARDYHIAMTLHNLALLYFRQEKYEQAEQFYTQSLVIAEQALGPEHPDIALVLSNLADVYQKQGEYAKAELLYHRLFVISGKFLDPKNPQLVIYYNGLATLYLLQEKYSEAEMTAQQALTLGEETLGPKHQRVATSVNTLANVYKAQGNYAKAEEFYQRALAILEDALGPNNVSVADTLQDYANLLQLMERQAEANELQQRSSTIRNTLFRGRGN